MLRICLAETSSELDQVYTLNQRYLKPNLSAEERQQEGFVTWLYAPELLGQMHSLAPSVLVKDGDKVVGYALTTLKEAAAFHPDLEVMFRNLAHLQYRDRPLLQHSFYCMGQVCIDKEYRGKGLFDLLYQGHRQFYHDKYNLLLTEISTGNTRSQRAHERVGFTTIHTYFDQLDEWKVVVWDWLL